MWLPGSGSGGGGGGSGDVTGPASAVDESVAVFDSTTGKLLKAAALYFLAVSKRLCFGGITGSDPALQVVSSFAGGPALRAVTASFSAGAGFVCSILGVPNDSTPKVLVDSSGVRLASDVPLAVSSTADASGTKDTGLDRAAAAGIAFNNGSAGGAGFAVLREMASPPGAIANAFVLWAEDNGSGKTRLMALPPTGAAVQLAIEP